MPCSDGISQRDYELMLHRENVKRCLKEPEYFNDTIKKVNIGISALNDLTEVATILKERNDNLAKMLCYVMNELNKDSQHYLCNSNSELKEWWDNHQLFDLERLVNNVIENGYK